MSESKEPDDVSESNRRLATLPISSEIEFLAVKAFASGSRVINARLNKLGLRVREYSVLAVACGEISATQRQLAAMLELDPSQIVALVDILEERNLVSREVDPTDRRSRVIRATPTGRALFKRARTVVAEAESRALGMLTTTERDMLRALLRKIVFSD